MEKSLKIDLIEVLEACIDSCEESVDASQSLISSCEGSDQIECDEERVRCAQIWDVLIEDCAECLEFCKKYQKESLADNEELVAHVIQACMRTQQIAQSTIQDCQFPDPSCIQSCMQLIKSANLCAQTCQRLIDQLD